MDLPLGKCLLHAGPLPWGDRKAELGTWKPSGNFSKPDTKAMLALPAAPRFQNCCKKPLREEKGVGEKLFTLQVCSPAPSPQEQHLSHLPTSQGYSLVTFQGKLA